jgi:alanyl-tRNA synthetase
LRFDFSHFAKVTDEELHQVEDFVNAEFRTMPLIERRDIPFTGGRRRCYGFVW